MGDASRLVLPPKPAPPQGGVTLAEVPVPWKKKCKLTTRSGCQGGDKETVWGDWEWDPDWSRWYCAPLVCWCAKCGHVFEDNRDTKAAGAEKPAARAGGRLEGHQEYSHDNSLAGDIH